MKRRSRQVVRQIGKDTYETEEDRAADQKRSHESPVSKVGEHPAVGVAQAHPGLPLSMWKPRGDDRRSDQSQGPEEDELRAPVDSRREEPGENPSDQPAGDRRRDPP